jgi:hypothetical protein
MAGQKRENNRRVVFGFKLHLIINDRGEIRAFQLTKSNISDVSMTETLPRGIFGKLFGYQGYLSSELGKKLLKRGLELFANIRSNMKQKLLSPENKILLSRRSLIETVNDQLKNISRMEHTRHRGIENFFVNILAGIAAYSHQTKKLSLNLDENENSLMIAI